MSVRLQDLIREKELRLRDRFRGIVLDRDHGFRLTVDNALIIDNLCANLAQMHVRTASTPFDLVGERKSREELERLVGAIRERNDEEFRDALSAMHAPAIDAIAAKGIMRSVSIEAPELLERTVSAIAEIKAPSLVGGRPPDRHARAVVGVLLQSYDCLRRDERRTLGVGRETPGRRTRMTGRVLLALRIPGTPTSLERDFDTRRIFSLLYFRTSQSAWG